MDQKPYESRSAWRYPAEGSGFFYATGSRVTRRRLAMFGVLGASGNTGKVVAETLLRQKQKVRDVLHDAAKGKAWGEAGADVAIADVDDGAALERAFSGAEGVYVLLPPNFSSSHVRVDNNSHVVRSTCS